MECGSTAMIFSDTKMCGNIYFIIYDFKIISLQWIVFFPRPDTPLYPVCRWVMILQIY